MLFTISNYPVKTLLKLERQWNPCFKGGESQTQRNQSVGFGAYWVIYCCSCLIFMYIWAGLSFFLSQIFSYFSGVLKVMVFSLALTGSSPAVACVWNKGSAEMSKWKKEYLWFSLNAEKEMIITFCFLTQWRHRVDLFWRQTKRCVSHLQLVSDHPCVSPWQGAESPGASLLLRVAWVTGRELSS